MREMGGVFFPSVHFDGVNIRTAKKHRDPGRYLMQLNTVFLPSVFGQQQPSLLNSISST